MQVSLFCFLLFQDWGLEIAFSFLRRLRKQFMFQKELPVTVYPVCFLREYEKYFFKWQK